jgi:hypothetical protein
VHQVDAKYPALLFKQQLTAFVEKIYSLLRDNVKKEITPQLGACIQAPRAVKGAPGAAGGAPGGAGSRAGSRAGSGVGGAHDGAAASRTRDDIAALLPVRNALLWGAGTATAGPVLPEEYILLRSGGGGAARAPSCGGGGGIGGGGGGVDAAERGAGGCGAAECAAAACGEGVK